MPRTKVKAVKKTTDKASEDGQSSARPKVREKVFAERFVEFIEQNALPVMQVRSIFGIASDFGVVRIRKGQTVPARPTQMLLAFYERYPQFVPRVQEVDPTEVMEMFQRVFPLRNWELALLYGLDYSRSYDWMRQRGLRPNVSSKGRISDLFMRMRSAGCSDEEIVRKWLTVWRDFYARQEKLTRQEKGLLERVEAWLSGGDVPIPRVRRPKTP